MRTLLTSPAPAAAQTVRAVALLLLAASLGFACAGDPDEPGGGGGRGDGGQKIDGGRTDGGGDGGEEDGGDGGEQSSDIAIRGDWDFPGGGLLGVTNERWETDASLERVVDFDNAARSVITQKPPTDLQNPSKYSRYAWAALGADTFALCLVEYGRDTEEAARGGRTADPDDLDGEGCLGLAWTRMTRRGADIAVRGRWREDGTTGRSHAIGRAEWAVSWTGPGGATVTERETVVEFDNNARFALTRRPVNATTNPGKYMKRAWTGLEADAFHTCVAAFNAATPEAAREAPQPDSGNLDTGCGGYPWIRLSRAP